MFLALTYTSYHVSLIHNNRCLWGIFCGKASKERKKFVQAANINAKSFLCNIHPDINLLPEIRPASSLFIFNDLPPALSSLELMNSSLRVSRIKLDTGNPNDFNTLSFQTQSFAASSFPRTFALIFPYR